MNTLKCWSASRAYLISEILDAIDYSTLAELSCSGTG